MPLSSRKDSKGLKIPINMTERSNDHIYIKCAVEDRIWQKQEDQ